MNVLQLTSSIRGADSISSKYASMIAKKLQEKGYTVKTRDLALNPVPVLTSDNLGALFSGTQTEYVAHSDELVKELLSTDVLVLGVPMYNFTIPSQLKNYIDATTRVGQTFRYTDKGPLGLTHIQKAYVVLSRGGFYDREAFDSQEKYLSMMLSFIGVKEIKFIFVEGLNMGADIARESLRQADNEVSELSV